MDKAVKVAFGLNIFICLVGIVLSVMLRGAETISTPSCISLVLLCSAGCLLGFLGIYIVNDHKENTQDDSESSGVQR